MEKLRPRATPKIRVIKWDTFIRNFIDTFGKLIIGEYLFIKIQD